MQLTVDVQVASNSSNIPEQQSFNHWVTTALSAWKNPQGEVEVSIRIVDREESQTLNKQYRQQNKPTNVLSFPSDFPEGVNASLLGDIVICAPLVWDEAKAQTKDLTAHWAHMVIHGTLHLLGYDHIDEKDAHEMETIESHLLQREGFNCPYLSQSDIDKVDAPHGD